MVRAAAPKPEDAWSTARLIPVVGMKRSKEQEERSTSALLAVMELVPSFGHAVLRHLDAPKGHISCFTEPPFETNEGGTVFPDGAIIVERGKTRWVCLVEVKTGDSSLSEDQVDRYLSIASSEGFDALLTISNQIVASPNESPVKVNKKQLKKVHLWHLSWFRILTEAVIEHTHKGVDDPEQAKVLDDLVAFLDDERSGAGGYDGMGRSWTAVRDAAAKGVLSAKTSGLDAVAEGWEQFLEYLSLKLRQNLGRPVAPVYPRASTTKTRFAACRTTLAQDHRLLGTIKVTDAIAPLDVEVDLKARQVTTRVRVPAPREGYPKTRINWLLRQLRDFPTDLRIEANYPRREPIPALAEVAVLRPESLLSEDDLKRAPGSFDVALTRRMGRNAGKGRASFVSIATRQVIEFYGDVVQDLQKWTPKAPRLPEEAIEAAQDDSPAP